MKIEEAITKAQRIKNIMETFEDIEIMTKLKGGESRRAADYVKEDIPLMIEAAKGGDPNKLPNLSNRQKALLSLGNKDMADAIEKNHKSAKKILGWHAPVLKPDIRAFINDQDGLNNALKEPLLRQQLIKELQPEKIFDKSIVNDHQMPLEEYILEKVKKQISEDHEFTPGMEVTHQINEKGEPLNNAEKSKIELIKVRKVSYIKYEIGYKLEGEDKYRSRSEIADPRNPESFFGVIMEKDQKMFFVPMQHEDLEKQKELGKNQLPARLISGLDIDMIRHENRQIAKDHKEYENDGEAPYHDNLKEKLLDAFPEQKEGSIIAAAEVRLRSVDGPEDKIGPVIIQSIPWTITAAEEEAKIAKEAVEKYMQKFEKPYGSIRDEMDKNKKMSADQAAKRKTILLAQNMHSSRSISL